MGLVNNLQFLIFICHSFVEFQTTSKLFTILTLFDVMLLLSNLKIVVRLHFFQ